MAVRIGELLLKEKRITAIQLQEALNYQKQNGGKLGANLVKMGFVKDEEITALLSKQYGVPSIALNQFEIDAAVIKLVPAETARGQFARLRSLFRRPDYPINPSGTTTWFVCQAHLRTWYGGCSSNGQTTPQPSVRR